MSTAAAPVILALGIMLLGRYGASPANSSHQAAAPGTSQMGIGGVMVKTDPPGAEFFVDGRPVRTTPLSASDLRAGDHSVEIRLAGFEPVFQRIRVRPDRLTDLGLVALQRSVGTLQVTSEPEGSDYVLSTSDGSREVRRGQTPDSISQLPTGEYRLRVTRAGWPAREQTIAVERQATRVASNRFGVGTLQVITDPPGAEIVADGKSLGRTPLSVPLPSGHYQALTAQMAEYHPVTFSAELRPGETATVPPVVLKPLPPSLAIATTPSGIPFQILPADSDKSASEAVEMGESPANIVGLAPGAYQLVLGGGRWPSHSLPFQIAERGKTTLSQDVPHGIVRIESQPAGAEIFEGNGLLGITPVSIPIPPGRHVLVATVEGRKAVSRTLDIADDQTKEIQFDIKGISTARTGHEIAHHRKRPRKHGEEPMLAKIGRSIKDTLMKAVTLPRVAKNRSLWD